MVIQAERENVFLEASPGDQQHSRLTLVAQNIETEPAGPGGQQCHPEDCALGRVFLDIR